MKKFVLMIVTVMLVNTVFAQGNKIPLIGSKAPEFTAKTTKGELTFPTDFGKSWKILFSHPADFTPVCSTELLELANLQPQFDKLDVKLAVISTNNVEMHKMWKSYLEELDYKNRGPKTIYFPLIEDEKAVNSKLYGMIHDTEGTIKTVRGVFVIDPQNVVRSVNFYPMQVGRNMDEIVRLVEALQTSDLAHVLMPANWKEGEDVLISYYPYTKEQVALNPDVQNDFYQLGNQIWFKRSKAK